MSHSGRYAKGIARREEILDRALAVIGEKGYRSTSLKEIAAAVGVTPPALLHYFDSKEALFVEVLRRRDERDLRAIQEQSDELSRSAFIDLIRHHATVPGLIQLSTRLAVDAADPALPAHAFFRERGIWLRDRIIEWTERLPSEARPDMPAAAFARVVQATVDGLHMQWLVDPNVDAAGTIDALLDALCPAAREDSIR